MLKKMSCMAQRTLLPSTPSAAFNGAARRIPMYDAHPKTPLLVCEPCVPSWSFVFSLHTAGRMQNRDQEDDLCAALSKGLNMK